MYVHYTDRVAEINPRRVDCDSHAGCGPPATVRNCRKVVGPFGGLDHTREECVEMAGSAPRYAVTARPTFAVSDGGLGDEAHLAP